MDALELCNLRWPRYQYRLQLIPTEHPAHSSDGSLCNGGAEAQDGLAPLDG